MGPDREAWGRLRDELLHPFRGAHMVLLDLGSGSGVLLGRWWRWTGRAEDLKGQLERIGGTLLGSAAGGYEVHRYAEVGGPILLVGWSAAALMHAPPRRRKPTPGVASDTPNDQEPGEPAPTPDPTDPRAQHLAEQQLIEYIEHQVAAARSQGHHGVHLAAILTGLHQRGDLTDWTTSDLGSRLRQAGIPIRPSLRVGPKVLAGVHHQDLAQHLGRAPRLPPHLVPDLTPVEDPVGAPGGAP